MTSRSALGQASSLRGSALAEIGRRHIVLRALVARELNLRYGATALGPLWLVVYPLLMLTVYTAVFSGIFGARWPGEPNLSAQAAILFTGLIFFHLLSDTISRAPSVVPNHAGLVRKLVFPMDLLPIVPLAIASIAAAVSSLFLIGYLFFYHGSFHMAWAFFPLLLVFFVVMSSGIAWVVSAVSVYLPDMQQFVTIALSMLLFLSPVFYPLSAVPQDFRFLVQLSPLTIPIEATRRALFFGESPSPVILVLYCCASILIAVFGFKIFARLQRDFSESV